LFRILVETTQTKVSIKRSRNQKSTDKSTIEQKLFSEYSMQHMLEEYKVRLLLPVYTIGIFVILD